MTYNTIEPNISEKEGQLKDTIKAININAAISNELANEDEKIANNTIWYDNPALLFSTKYITELYPKENMTQEQKLNAITRVITFVTLLGYLFTLNLRILVVGFITNLVIFGMYKTRKPKLVENFEKLTSEDVNVKLVEFKEIS
jgi:hypothetical protein